MANHKKLEEDIQFVTRYYRDDTLLPARGWRLFRANHGISAFRRNIAAAAVALIVLSASASFYFYLRTNAPSSPQTELSTPAPTVALAETKQKIEFRDADLSEVVAEIEKIYDVKITGLPQQEIKVNISYEGTAAEVVETLNELFDTELAIESETETPSKQ